MSGKAWDDMMERLAAVERCCQRTPAEYAANYDAPARREDERLARGLQRSGDIHLCFPLGSFTSNRPEMARVQFTWSTSYATGGEPVNGVTDLVHGFVTVEAAPVAGMTFDYDIGGGRLKAYITAGTEVAAGTNLQAAIGTIWLTVIGAQRTTFPVYRAADGDSIRGAWIEAEDSLTASSTSYWTLVLRARAPASGLSSAEEFGRDIGDTITTSTLSLVARQPVAMYDDGAGFALSADTDVVLNVTPTGNPPRLDGAMLVIRLLRSVT